MRRHHIRPRHAFSLVELLAVIGIISLLLALLLPALARAREQANAVQCLANLRSIGQAALMHVNEHRGYLPTGGQHWNCVGGVCDPAGLEDSEERKYMYYLDEGIKRPLPLTAALGHYMGVEVRTDSREALAEDLAGEKLRRRFRCPSQLQDYAGWTQRGDEGGAWVAPDSWSGYVFNTALVGRRDYNTPRCPKGLLSRVREPSKVYFACDGRPRDSSGLRYLLIPEAREDQTLYDAYQSILRTGNGVEALDFGRHRLRINVVFCDGHAASVPMGLPPGGGEGLKDVYASKGIAY